MAYTISNAFITKFEMTNDGNFNKLEDLAASAMSMSAIPNDEIIVRVRVSGPSGFTESGQVIRYMPTFSSSIDTWSPMPTLTNSLSYFTSNLKYIKGEDIGVEIRRWAPDNTTAATGSIDVSTGTGSPTIVSPSGKSNPYNFSSGETINGGTSWKWVITAVNHDTHTRINVEINEGGS